VQKNAAVWQRNRQQLRLAKTLFTLLKQGKAGRKIEKVTHIIFAHVRTS